MIEEVVNISGSITPGANITGNIGSNKMSANVTIPKTVTEKNYNKLNNKPQINSIELINNKTSEELGLQPAGDYADSRITNLEIDALF